MNMRHSTCCLVVCCQRQGIRGFALAQADQKFASISEGARSKMPGCCKRFTCFHGRDNSFASALRTWAASTLLPVSFSEVIARFGRLSSAAIKG